jgi:glycosyltransferase involved in cell wall biosynthesis
MPMTILESFREGTLVLASNIGSIKSIIKDKYNGILFNPNDPTDIQNKVKWVLNNPIKCDEIALNAMKDFKNIFSDEINYKILMEIYNEIIDNKFSKF